MNLKIGDKVALRRSARDVSLGVITGITSALGSLGLGKELYIITWFDVHNHYYHSTTNGFNYTAVWREDYLALRQELGIDAHN